MLKEKIKVGFSSSKINCLICFNESPLKMLKIVYYFILEARFVLTVFKNFSCLFAHFFFFLEK